MARATRGGQSETVTNNLFHFLPQGSAIYLSRRNFHFCVDVPAATIRGCHFHFCVCDLAWRNPVFTFTFMADLAPPPAAAAAAAAAVAPVPPAPPDALAALRARASFLGAPLDVFDTCLEKYVLFAEEGVAPKIVFKDGVFLEKAPTMEAAYVPYFKPVWDATAGRLKLKCECCKTGPISYHVVGAKHTFPFSNALDHLKRCPGLPPLLPEHIADRKGVKQEPPQPQPDHKRVRILDGPEEHLGFLGLDQGQYRYLLLRSILADAQPRCWRAWPRCTSPPSTRTARCTKRPTSCCPRTTGTS